MVRASGEARSESDFDVPEVKRTRSELVKSMSTPDARVLFLQSYERLAEMRTKMKEEMVRFKVLQEDVHTYLLQHGGGFQLSEYSVTIRKHRKALGQLKLTVVGTGYVDFQHAHGRSDVSTEEKSAFMATIQKLQRAVPRPEQQVVKVVRTT
jgi:hypothetical protein